MLSYRTSYRAEPYKLRAWSWHSLFAQTGCSIGRLPDPGVVSVGVKRSASDESDRTSECCPRPCCRRIAHPVGDFGRSEGKIVDADEQTFVQHERDGFRDRSDDLSWKAIAASSSITQDVDPLSTGIASLKSRTLLRTRRTGAIEVEEHPQTVASNVSGSYRIRITYLER